MNVQITRVKKPLTLLKVIVFDLDDTLYSELDYVRSGLEQVAFSLTEEFCIPKQTLYKLLLKSLEISRSEIFNRVLKEIGFFNQANLKRCIQLYRQHEPQIYLYSSTLEAIKKLAESYSIYIVTDGHKLVQERKLRALKLYDSSFIQKAFITHRYGLNNAKPSPYCFNLICKAEKVSPENVVYIADNAKKDFIGIKPLGFKTIRVNIGQHKHACYSIEHEAELVVKDLSDAIQSLGEL
ncbi:MAG: haloacid dehalogenase [Gammaproteobacteria bacterium]|nr:MAG: haloacid dehalogenase [Gammaproteobacteria bacterium]